jgi:hypothetical protein
LLVFIFGVNCRCSEWMVYIRCGASLFCFYLFFLNEAITSLVQSHILWDIFHLEFDILSKSDEFVVFALNIKRYMLIWVQAKPLCPTSNMLMFNLHQRFLHGSNIYKLLLPERVPIPFYNYLGFFDVFVFDNDHTLKVVSAVIFCYISIIIPRFEVLLFLLTFHHINKQLL